MIKTFDNQLYKNLWASAAEELKNATEIIFIGYSLPIADFELKYILQSNIKPEAKINVILHNNDDPSILTKKHKHLMSHLPEKRYKDVFQRHNCSFFYNGFAEYFNDRQNN